MAAKLKTAKQFYAQDKDFLLFSNIEKAHTGLAHAVTATYKRRTYYLVKTESDGSEKAAKSAPVGRSSLLPRIIIQLYYTKFKNSCLVGAKCLFLFYIENQSARQPCNVHVSGSTGNSHLYRLGTGCECNQRCLYVLEVYTEHTWGKMRHLKPVCNKNGYYL